MFAGLGWDCGSPQALEPKAECESLVDSNARHVV